MRDAVDWCTAWVQGGASAASASGPLRTFVLGGSDYRNHTMLARRLHTYLRWRNANARHPDVLAAQRREPARVRSERQHRWGRPRTKAA